MLLVVQTHTLGDEFFEMLSKDDHALAVWNSIIPWDEPVDNPMERELLLATLVRKLG